MEFIEIEAKTVQEAIAIACKQLQTTEDNIDVEILENSSGKILSLFSGKKARIRASRARASGAADQNAIEQLREILEKIVQHVCTGAAVQARLEEEEIILDIVGSRGGLFIGRRGQTLEALQYLMNKIRLGKFKDAPHVLVDSENYRSRHIDSLVVLAKRLSEKAKEKRSPVMTDPLCASDRRIIHLTLKKDAELTTWSKGDGHLKKVIIAPRQP